LRALARVGDRRTPLVVEALPGGPQRFNDLPGQIPRIAANILSERLKRLGLGPRASPALMIEARSASVST
jgi:DNA-binding HxlR family transcriptional regulator